VTPRFPWWVGERTSHRTPAPGPVDVRRRDQTEPGAPSVRWRSAYRTSAYEG
jgi:hypothetical protein